MFIAFFVGFFFYFISAMIIGWGFLPSLVVAPFPGLTTLYLFVLTRRFVYKEKQAIVRSPGEDIFVTFLLLIISFIVFFWIFSIEPEICENVSYYENGEKKTGQLCGEARKHIGSGFQRIP